MVSPGDAAWAKRSMGRTLKAAAPASVLEVLERKLRRVRACVTGIILFMALELESHFSDARKARRYSTAGIGRRQKGGDCVRACPAGIQHALECGDLSPPFIAAACRATGLATSRQTRRR